MGFWTTVMSTPAGEMSILTDMTQPTPPGDPPILLHKVQCDLMEVDAQSLTAPATTITTDIDNQSAPMNTSPSADRTQMDDVDMEDVEISNIDGAADDEKATRLPPKSRFANLGLNARPLKFAGGKCRAPAISVDSKERTPFETSYQRKWMQEEEDLTELETLLVPAGLRQAYRDGGALPMDPRPFTLTLKTSKYTTGFLTESGWHPIENDEWKIASERNHADEDLADVALVNEFTGYNDLPGKLAKAKVVPEEPLRKADFDAAVAELMEDAEKPLVDEKYFDLDNYLEYARNLDKRPAKKGSPSKSSRALVVPGPVQTVSRKGGVVKAPPGESFNSLDVGASAANNAAAPAIRRESVVSSDLGQTELSDEETRVIAHSRQDDTPANASTDDVDPEGVWELVDSDTNSIRLGHPTPEKLTIRLRHNETGKIETPTFGKLSHHFIDWSNKAHVQEIADWRYQVLHRRGVHRNTEQTYKPNVKRTHNMYLPDEEAWLMLFHKKIKLVVEAGHNIKLAGPVATMERFNYFFLGKVLQGPGGEDLPPREARDEISMKGKLYHVKSGIKPMRDVMRKLLEGKHDGVMYVPFITEDELKQYREKGTVVMENPDDVNQDAASQKRKRETMDAEGLDDKRVKK